MTVGHIIINIANTALSILIFECFTVCGVFLLLYAVFIAFEMIVVLLKNLLGCSSKLAGINLLLTVFYIKSLYLYM